MGKTIQIGTRKGLFILSKNGSGWSLSEPLFPGVAVSMTLHDSRSGYCYAALGHGHFGCKLQRSKDHGKTWEEITAPAFPPKPENEPEVLCPMRKVPIPWNVELIWSLETGAADGQLWCGTIPGALFRSNDHGESWELNRPLWDKPERAKWFGGGYDYPGIHSICAHPEDKKHLYLCISCGGVQESTDDGASWKTVADGLRNEYTPPDQAQDPDTQDGHRMVICRDQPNNLWIQHHNGIFRTTNGCEKWEEITTAKPSVFGFAVAVHPKDGNTAWFAPAIKDETRIPTNGEFLINRTTDGGKTFTQLRKGLPEGKSYDLVYRHAMDIDDTGEVLVVGSTTGSLWVTEDSGDTWQEISANLPPVYSVRFCI